MCTTDYHATSIQFCHYALTLAARCRHQHRHVDAVAYLNLAIHRHHILARYQRRYLAHAHAH